MKIQIGTKSQVFEKSKLKAPLSTRHNLWPISTNKNGIKCRYIFLLDIYIYFSSDVHLHQYKKYLPVYLFVRNIKRNWNGDQIHSFIDSHFHKDIKYLPVPPWSLLKAWWQLIQLVVFFTAMIFVHILTSQSSSFVIQRCSWKQIQWLWRQCLKRSLQWPGPSWEYKFVTLAVFYVTVFIVVVFVVAFGMF